WVEQMTTYKVPCQPSGIRPEDVPNSRLNKDNSDWVQGYCYQMWRCRHNAVRADGAQGQYIIVMPDQDAVVIVTESARNLQKVLDAVWDLILPELEK
ncbi:MAG: serine hydrolase, partial [Bacteroidales bacterium]|nr:serine hydrolase [Bacteroidales bacterium]